MISLPRGGEVVIFLSWDDPMGGSANNYDLFLVEKTTGRIVAASRDVQRGAQDPQEFIDYVNNGSSGLFEMVVQNVLDNAQPKHLNLYSFEPECANDGPRTLAANRHERHNYNTATYSITAQSDAAGSPAAVVVGRCHLFGVCVGIRRVSIEPEQLVHRHDELDGGIFQQPGSDNRRAHEA